MFNKYAVFKYKHVQNIHFIVRDYKKIARIIFVK